MPLKTKNFSWNTSLNLSHNLNKLVSLTKDVYRCGLYQYCKRELAPVKQMSALQLLKPGLPVGQFFTFKYAGKDDQRVNHSFTIGMVKVPNDVASA